MARIWTPGPAPVAAGIESYEFKEWLNEINAFFKSEMNYYDVDDYIARGLIVAGGGPYPLRLDYSNIVFGTNDLLFSPFTQHVVPQYDQCLGKWYKLGKDGLYGFFPVQYKAGNKESTIATYAVDTNSTWAQNSFHIATEDGWSTISFL